MYSTNRLNLFYMLTRFFLLFSLFFTLSCRDRNPKKEVNKTELKKEVNNTIPKLKIFIEDGRSMVGFFENSYFDFSADLSSLFSKLKSSSKELNLISNNSIKKISSKNNLDFSIKLSNLKDYDRELGESSFETMLDSVLSNTNKNTVTAFVSDYIQSSTDLTNDIAGDYISSLLSKKLEKNKKIAICILKMKSRFKGHFYYVSQQRKSIIPNPETIDEIKPYYVWFFGDNDLIEKLNLNHNSIKSLNLKGFEDFSIYNEKNYYSTETPINWTILPYTNSIGTCKPLVKNNSFEVHNISNVKTDRISSEFKICIAVDLSEVPLDESYKTDSNNYILKNSGFKFDYITKLDGNLYNYKGEELEIDNKDKKKIETVKPTHLFFFKSSKKVVSNIEFSMQRKISPVLINSNSNDESNLINLKTYGFENFTNAVQRSFPKYENKSSYFPIKVEIENNKGGISWVGIILLIVAVSIIIFVFIKNKK